MAQQITIEVKLIKIGSGFIAATSLAGITIRGRTTHIRHKGIVG